MPCCKVLGDRVVRFWLMNWLKSTTKNAAKQFGILFCSVFAAEREGFEPPDPRRSTVFKTAAFDRSAIFPFAKQEVTRIICFLFGFANIRRMSDIAKKSLFSFKMRIQSQQLVFFLYICTVEKNRPYWSDYYIKV